MKITLPQILIEWTNNKWPELVKIGGLGSVKYKVVEKLPFNSDAAAMTWRGEVLIKRDWIAPALLDLGTNNEISLKHMWALAVLAWHEPCHVIEQRKTSWLTYLLHYGMNCLRGWAKGKGLYRGNSEEECAFEHQAKFSQKWNDELPAQVSGWSWRKS